MASKLRLLIGAIVLFLITYHSSASEAKSGFGVRPTKFVGTRVKFNFAKFRPIKLGHFPILPKVPITPPPATPPGAVQYVYPEDYGAKKDGVTDDAPAIQQAINVARSRNNTQVYIRSGPYICKSQIVADSVQIHADSNALLYFTNSQSAGVRVTGNGTLIDGGEISLAGQSDDPSIAGLSIYQAKNFTINFVTIGGGSSDSVDCFYSGPGSISLCTITATVANGLLIRDCTNISIVSNRMESLAVLSGGGKSTGLVFNNNTIAKLTDGLNDLRIPKLAGLSDSSFVANAIGRGALYIGPSSFPPNNPGFADGSVSNLYIANNVVDGMTVQNPPNNYSGIVLNALGPNFGTIDTISLVTNRVQNLGQTVAGIYVGAGTRNAFIDGNIVATIHNMQSNVDSAAIGILIATTDNIMISANDLRDISLTAIASLTNYGSGALNILENKITNVCQLVANPGSDKPIILINAAVAPAQPASISVTQNNYAGPANNATYYVECLQPSSAGPRTIDGNTQATMLPNNIVP